MAAHALAAKSRLALTTFQLLRSPFSGFFTFPLFTFQPLVPCPSPVMPDLSEFRLGYHDQTKKKTGRKAQPVFSFPTWILPTDPAK
jgi:hypothetical protein